MSKKNSTQEEQINIKNIIPKILNMMVEAKRIISEKDISSEEKDGIGNIVTSTDKKLDKHFNSSLRKEFPNSVIISEESAENNKENNTNGLKFVVDPLDGTTNFTNGWPHTVAIGIVYDNELISGVIYDILSDKIYFSIKGSGVFVCDMNDLLKLHKNTNSEQSTDQIFHRIIQPEQSTENIKKAVISYDIPYGAEAFKTTQEMSSKLYFAGASLKTVGPISLDVLKTALGKENRPTDYNNAVWHTEVRAWDLAASTAILRELGGEIIGKDGKPLSIKTLTSPTAKIAFIASGNQKMIENLFTIYKQAEKNNRKDEGR